MKRSLAFLFLGAALVAAPSFLREEHANATSGSVKVGVLDLERALASSPAGKEAAAKLEKLNKEKQAELDKEKKALFKYKSELEKQATVLKEETLAKKQAELQQKLVDLNDTYLRLEKELAAEQSKLVQEALKTASPFVEKLATDEGVDLIVDINAVVWSSKTVDLTDALIAKMK